MGSNGDRWAHMGSNGGRLKVTHGRPGQVFKLSWGGLAQHNFPYADLPAFIDPIKTNECDTWDKMLDTHSGLSLEKDELGVG